MNSIENTQPYKVALEYIEHDDKIQAITGGVKGIGILGRVLELEQSSSHKNGKAKLELPIKGEREDLSIAIFLLQDSTDNWVVKKVMF